MLRHGAIALLGLAGCAREPDCVPWDEVVVVRTSLDATDADVAEVQAALRDMEAWTGLEAICVQRVEIVDSEAMDERAYDWAIGEYDGSSKLLLEAGEFDRRTVIHELCHAVDATLGWPSMDAPVLDEKAARLSGSDLYEGRRLRRAEAFAQICDDGPDEVGVFAAAAGACPTSEPLVRRAPGDARRWVVETAMPAAHRLWTLPPVSSSEATLDLGVPRFSLSNADLVNHGHEVHDWTVQPWEGGVAATVSTWLGGEATGGRWVLPGLADLSTGTFEVVQPAGLPDYDPWTPRQRISWVFGDADGVHVVGESYGEDGASDRALFALEDGRASRLVALHAGALSVAGPSRWLVDADREDRDGWEARSVTELWPFGASGVGEEPAWARGAPRPWVDTVVADPAGGFWISALEEAADSGTIPRGRRWLIGRDGGGRITTSIDLLSNAFLHRDSWEGTADTSGLVDGRLVMDVVLNGSGEQGRGSPLTALLAFDPATGRAGFVEDSCSPGWPTRRAVAWDGKLVGLHEEWIDGEPHVVADIRSFDW
jgi:hypothetical protein